MQIFLNLVNAMMDIEFKIYTDRSKLLSDFSSIITSLSSLIFIKIAEQYDIHVNVVRPFHTYGPGIDLNDGRVFSDFVANAVEGNNIILKSDGLAKRPFCYISDAVIGFLMVLISGKNAEAYNVGNPEAEVSIRDLAYQIRDLFPKLNLEVEFDIKDEDDKYIKSPVLRSCPSIDKISDIGWTPSIGIKEGFNRTVKSFL